MNSVIDIKHEYEFHKEDCDKDTTPFLHPNEFYRRGKSSANSQKWQCKSCHKITNVLPDKRQRFSYIKKGMKYCLDSQKTY